jgi:hypothetical protein
MPFDAVELAIDIGPFFMPFAMSYNLCLRPSCYKCNFKSESRNSDITLADFWGIQNVAPEMDDDKGTSLVIVHSEKAKRLFAEIENEVVCKEVDFSEAIKYNSAMIQSAYRPQRRTKFMRVVTSENFDLIAKKYSAPTLIAKIKSLIKRVLRKIKGN